MGFMESLESTLNDSKKLTENGAVGYATTGRKLLDLNFAVSSMRNWSDKKIEDEFIKAYFENPLLAIKWLFYLRDIRGNGMGERRSFRVCYSWLAKNKSDIAKALIPIINEYGRYDDLWKLLDTSLKDEVIKYIEKNLDNDMQIIMNTNKTGSISLLAKWLPSANASSKETKRYAQIIIKGLGVTERKYRKMLSALRKYLDVVEVKMSNKEWPEINYSAVPSRANLIYNDAFLRNDEERRRAYLESVKKGETKINAGTLFPHDIVHKYTEGGSRVYNNYNEGIEQLWNALPDTTECDGNTLVIRDGSGSMTSSVGNTRVSAMDISTALAIYFAERSTGEFHNKFITFGAKPQIVNIENAETLRDKLNICYKYTDCSNTNIEATFDLILNTAVKSKMSQEDLPKNVLIVSDMEFDSVARGGYSWGWRESVPSINKTLFETIEKKFKALGYKMPRLIFWNVCSRTGTIPVKENEMGVALVSGFSPAVYKMVLSDKLDPFECLLDQINDKRYDLVEKLIKDKIK